MTSSKRSGCDRSTSSSSSGAASSGDAARFSDALPRSGLAIDSSLVGSTVRVQWHDMGWLEGEVVEYYAPGEEPDDAGQHTRFVFHQHGQSVPFDRVGIAGPQVIGGMAGRAFFDFQR